MGPSIDPQWWHNGSWSGEPLRDILARHDIAAIFRFLRSRGLSQTAISKATDISTARISEIMNGKRQVADYQVLQRICLGLAIPRTYMGLGYEDNQPAHVAPPEPEPIDHRDLIGTLAAVTVNSSPSDLTRWLPNPATTALPATVTEYDIATIRAVTWFHRQLDVAAGGGTCLHSAAGYVAWATQLLHLPSASDHVGNDLRVALAELHSLVGWAAHDLAAHDNARRHLTQGLVLARETGALQLAANILYRLGRVSLHQRDAEGALQLFGLGQIVAQQARCPASIAILHSNSAWAYALLGADDQVRESLRRARGELQRAQPDDAPAWTKFAFADADPHGLAAVIYTMLARHPQHRGFADTALNEATEAVKLRRPEDRRSLAFDLISAATAATLIGDYDQAAAWGTDAMALTEQMRSARVHDRLLDMWQLAMPAAADHPELQRLGHRLVAHTTE